MSLAGDADAKRRKKRKAKPPKPLKMLKTPFLDATEARVWHELRLVRQSPRHYAASKMKAFKGRYEGANIKVGDTLLQTNEGTRPVDEAIAEMARIKRTKRIKLVAEIARAAKDHAVYMGKTGSTDHVDGRGYGPGARLDAYGSWSTRNAQILSFQFSEPTDIVAWLLTNDGIASRGYRRALLNKRFRVGGVGCANHKEYTFTCVIVLTEKFRKHRNGPRPLRRSNNQLKVYVQEKQGK